jgi:hypothetical protein
VTIVHHEDVESITVLTKSGAEYYLNLDDEGMSENMTADLDMLQGLYEINPTTYKNFYALNYNDIV